MVTDTQQILRHSIWKNIKYNRFILLHTFKRFDLMVRSRATDWLVALEESRWIQQCANRCVAKPKIYGNLLRHVSGGYCSGHCRATEVCINCTKYHCCNTRTQVPHHGNSPDRTTETCVTNHSENQGKVNRMSGVLVNETKYHVGCSICTFVWYGSDVKVVRPQFVTISLRPSNVSHMILRPH